MKNNNRQIVYTPLSFYYFFSCILCVIDPWSYLGSNCAGAEMPPNMTFTLVLTSLICFETSLCMSRYHINVGEEIPEDLVSIGNK